MKTKTIIAILIIACSLIGLFLLKDVKTCADSGIGCQSMQELFFAMLPQLLFIVLGLIGLFTLLDCFDF